MDRLEDEADEADDVDAGADDAAGDDMFELERGRVRFFVRPRVEVRSPLSLSDVQRFFFLLIPSAAGRRGANRRAAEWGEPDEAETRSIELEEREGSEGTDPREARLVRVGRKRMPAGARDRCWAPVERVGPLAELLAGLGPRSYETKTRRLRHQAAAIEVARGSYAVTAHHEHAHLLYSLDEDDEPSPLLGPLHLQREGGCIAAVFNPEMKWRARDREQPDTPFREPSMYDDELQERFGDRRFAPLEPAFLDREGTELVLIGARSTRHQTTSTNGLLGFAKR